MVLCGHAFLRGRSESMHHQCINLKYIDLSECNFFKLNHFYSHGALHISILETGEVSKGCLYEPFDHRLAPARVCRPASINLL